MGTLHHSKHIKDSELSGEYGYIEVSLELEESRGEPALRQGRIEFPVEKTETGPSRYFYVCLSDNSSVLIGKAGTDEHEIFPEGESEYHEVISFQAGSASWKICQN